MPSFPDRRCIDSDHIKNVIALKQKNKKATIRRWYRRYFGMESNFASARDVSINLDGRLFELSSHIRLKSLHNNAVGVCTLGILAIG